MLSRSLAAAALAAGALAAQSAEAGPFRSGPSATPTQVQPVFHERGYWSNTAPPAYAPPPRYAPALLPPRQIERLLRRDGYSRLEVVALEGPIYTIQGIDPWDNFVEMKVFGEDGRVLRSDPIQARLYDTPFAAPPPAAAPDRAYRPPVEDGPRIVGAIPQAPRAVQGRSEPQVVTAPLPRERPDYRPQLSEPARRTQPDPAISEPDERPGDRDPLVVY